MQNGTFEPKAVIDEFTDMRLVLVNALGRMIAKQRREAMAAPYETRRIQAINNASRATTEAINSLADAVTHLTSYME